MKPLESESPPHDPEISLFLLLCPEHQRLIERISSKCRSVVRSDSFVPHMTMYFGSGVPVRGMNNLVESVASLSGPVTQRIVGIGGEARFWRASYIELSGGLQTEAIDGALKRDIAPYGAYSYFPHVSLVYSNEITSDQQEQCRLIAEADLRDARVEELIFDRVGLFQRHSSDGVWEDVSRWREVCSARLRGTH